MRIIALRLSRLGVLLLLVLVALFVLAVPAFAAGGETQLVNLFDTAQLLALIGGVLIPFLVALLAKQHAAGLVKSLIAGVSAGLLALGLYLTNAAGAHTWEGGLSVFVIAIVAAASSRVTITGGADDALGAKVPGGIG